MEEYIEMNEWFDRSIKAYTDNVHQRFSEDAFEQQRAAWLERQKMLDYFRVHPPANESVAASYGEEMDWLDDRCNDSWKLGREQIKVIQSDRLEIANAELWQVTYKAEIEGFAYLSVALYSEDGVKHISTYLIEED